MLDNIYGPVIPKHFWVFSAPMMDFTLAPIIYLEEISGPAFDIEIDGTVLTVPSSWSLMVTDDEQCMVDTVPINICSRNDYHALLMLDNVNKHGAQKIRVIDFHEHKTLVYPMLDKGCMLCTPIKQEKIKGVDAHYCAIIGPTDISGKYFSDVSIGDIFY